MTTITARAYHVRQPTLRMSEDFWVLAQGESGVLIENRLGTDTIPLTEFQRAVEVGNVVPVLVPGTEEG